MGEHKNPGFMILFFTSRKKKVQERVSFIPVPSLRLVLHLSSVLSLSIPASFYSIYSYSTVNHFLKKKKRVSESEWGRKAERNPEIADGSGIFFFMFLSFRIWTGDVEKR